jgi:hypothetical protein
MESSGEKGGPDQIRPSRSYLLSVSLRGLGLGFFHLRGGFWGLGSLSSRLDRFWGLRGRNGYGGLLAGRATHSYEKTGKTNDDDGQEPFHGGFLVD